MNTWLMFLKIDSMFIQLLEIILKAISFKVAPSNNKITKNNFNERSV